MDRELAWIKNEGEKNVFSPFMPVLWSQPIPILDKDMNLGDFFWQCRLTKNVLRGFIIDAGR
jgi:hypothetical protein